MLPQRSVLPDVLLAVTLTALTSASLVQETDGRLHPPTLVLAVLATAPVALRQRAPVLTMCAGLAALAAYPLVHDRADIANGGVALLIAMFTVATLRSRRTAAGMFSAALVVVTAYLLGLDATAGSELAQTALVLFMAWVLGDSTKRWAERAGRAAADAERAVADERVRIARELHDIVAHHMSVISLQAGLAEYVLDDDPATAKGAIAAVGSAGRAALGDLRRMLDVLRLDSDGAAELSPQPGLAVLDQLVEHARQAGIPVDVVVTGTPRPLPPGPDLCAYRAVQESLTNVLKHAGPARAYVQVDHGEHALTIQVSNTGSAPSRHPLLVSPAGAAAADTPARGHGLRGMQERAALYGGDVTAGPLSGGGYAVVLRLPRQDA